MFWIQMKNNVGTKNAFVVVGHVLESKIRPNIFLKYLKTKRPGELLGRNFETTPNLRAPTRLPHGNPRICVGARHGPPINCVDPRRGVWISRWFFGGVAGESQNARGNVLKFANVNWENVANGEIAFLTNLALTNNIERHLT